MIKVPWITDNPQYPHYLQYQFVRYVFRFLHPFTDKDITDIAEIYRLIWKMDKEEKLKQATRLELLNALKAVKRQKVEIEKRVLQNQIRKLELL